MGKFESIHAGHRALIAEMIKLARPGIATALVVFEPHPYRVLSDPGYRPLFTRHEREHLVRGLGVDYLLEYHFDHSFAEMPPEDFCRKLCEELRAKTIVVGEGYRFGHKRAGTVDTLRQAAGRYHAQVHVTGHHRVQQSGCDTGESGADKTSTSAIRALLSASRLPEAEALLGNPFFVTGEAMPGRQLGFTADFPTIYICVPEEKYLPPDGVYATRATIDGYSCNGVTSIDLRRADKKPGAPRVVETHLQGFTGGDLYGKQVCVDFLRLIKQ